MLSPHARRSHVRVRASTTMALLEYFKREDAHYAVCKLPDPQGALTKEVPPSTVSAVNTKVVTLQPSAGAGQWSLPEN